MDEATLRALVQTDLPSAALQVYLLAATEAVDERLGVGPITDGGTAHGPLFGLSRPAAEVLEAVAEGRVLDPADYSLRPSGRLLVRAHGRRWGRAQITYQPRSAAGRRNGAIAALVALEIANKHGLASVKFGSWSESYQQQPGSYETDREAILCALFDDEAVLA